MFDQTIETKRAIARLTSELFQSITNVPPQMDGSQWMAGWVLLMYEGPERAWIRQILTSYVMANRERLTWILGESVIRQDRVADYLTVPATLAVLERLSSKPMIAAHIWRQGLGTPEDLADLAALVGVGL